jgi:hypothetical protein
VPQKLMPPFAEANPEQRVRRHSLFHGRNGLANHEGLQQLGDQILRIALNVLAEAVDLTARIAGEARGSGSADGDGDDGDADFEFGGCFRVVALDGDVGGEDIPVGVFGFGGEPAAAVAVDGGDDGVAGGLFDAFGFDGIHIIGFELSLEGDEEWSGHECPFISQEKRNFIGRAWRGIGTGRGCLFRLSQWV